MVVHQMACRDSTPTKPVRLILGALRSLLVVLHTGPLTINLNFASPLTTEMLMKTILMTAIAIGSAARHFVRCLLATHMGSGVAIEPHRRVRYAVLFFGCPWHRCSCLPFCSCSARLCHSGLQIAGLLTANGFTAVPDARLSNLEFHYRAIRRVSPRWGLHLGAQGRLSPPYSLPCVQRQEQVSGSVSAKYGRSLWRLLARLTMSEQSRENASSSPGVLR